jgi:hypothetical protein
MGPVLKMLEMPETLERREPMLGKTVAANTPMAATAAAADVSAALRLRAE